MSAAKSLLVWSAVVFSLHGFSVEVSGATSPASFAGDYELKYIPANSNAHMELKITQNGAKAEISFLGHVEMPSVDPDGEGTATLVSPDTLDFDMSDSFDNGLKGKIHREKNGALKISFEPVNPVNESRCLPLYSAALLVEKNRPKTEAGGASDCSIDANALAHTTSMKIIVHDATPRVYFQTRPKGCPAKGRCEWRAKSYLVGGDAVVADEAKRSGDFRCVGYRAKKGKIISGWISVKNLEPFGHESR
jgi:hypothetical protein